MFSFDENKLEYWEAHLSDASRQYQHLTWWEAEQIQKQSKLLKTAFTTKVRSHQ